MKSSLPPALLLLATLLLAACQSAPPPAAEDGAKTVGNWSVRTSGSVMVETGVVHH